MTQTAPKTQATRLALVEKTVAAQAAELESLRALMEATEARSKETHDAVARIEAALFKPAPGHDKPLIDRFAAATIKIEGAGATLSVLFWIAAGVTAMGGAFLVIRRSLLGD